MNTGVKTDTNVTQHTDTVSTVMTGVYTSFTWKPDLLVFSPPVARGLRQRRSSGAGLPGGRAGSCSVSDRWAQKPADGAGATTPGVQTRGRVQKEEADGIMFDISLHQVRLGTPQPIPPVSWLWQSTSFGTFLIYLIWYMWLEVISWVKCHHHSCCRIKTKNTCSDWLWAKPYFIKCIWLSPGLFQSIP